MRKCKQKNKAITRLKKRRERLDRIQRSRQREKRKNEAPVQTYLVLTKNGYTQ